MRQGARSDAVFAAKAEQKKHSDWFIAQRNELERMSQSGQSNETLFEQADKCGDDSLHTPSGGGRGSRAKISRSTPTACLCRRHRSSA
eukprot:6198483-Pleurochrysis_carterae.AAC.2